MTDLPPAQANADLERLQQDLADVLARLQQTLDAATTADQIHAASGEIIEVTHRITMVGRLLFHARTDAIQHAVDDVAQAKAQVSAAIAKIDKLNEFIQAVSGFLGLVDKAIDTAKSL